MSEYDCSVLLPFPSWPLPHFLLFAFLKSWNYDTGVLHQLCSRHLQLGKAVKCENQKSEVNLGWKFNPWVTLTNRGFAKKFKRQFRDFHWVRSHSSRAVNMPVARWATADQRQGWEIGETPQQDTVMPSQHAWCLTHCFRISKPDPEGTLVKQREAKCSGSCFLPAQPIINQGAPARPVHFNQLSNTVVRKNKKKNCGQGQNINLIKNHRRTKEKNANTQ